jgi:RNA polymerase sigma-70 factor, ECF subfamily
MDGILLQVDLPTQRREPGPSFGRVMPAVHHSDPKKESIANAMTVDEVLEIPPPIEGDLCVRPGAQARFRAIVDSHFNFVWRYLRALGVPHANADDATQQVFLVAASKVDLIEEGRERSFLVGTAHGVAANARRANERRREVQGEGDLSLQIDNALDPEQQTESREALAILDRFLETLAPDLRTVFVLFELEAMTMAAISETLGIPAGTVASRLRRAREEFHDMAKRVQAGVGTGTGSGSGSGSGKSGGQRNRS